MNITHLLKKEALIVDDTPSAKLKIEMKFLLESLGFSIIWCLNWDKLLTIYEERRFAGGPFPSIVFMDLHFSIDHLCLGDNSSKEGYLMTKQLLVYCSQMSIRKPAIIIYTGVESAATAMHAIEAGATDFISAEEFSRRGHLAKRLSMIMRTNLTSSEQNDLSQTERLSIDLDILKTAKVQCGNDLTKAAKLLKWPLSEVCFLNSQLKEGA